MKKKGISATTLSKMMSRNEFSGKMPKPQVVPNKKKKDPKYKDLE